MSAILESPRPIRGAFDADVITDQGRIDVKLLATSLDLPMSTIAPALGLKPRTVNDNPTGASLQPKAAVLLAMANDLAIELGEKRFVVLYLKSPRPEFKGKAAADLLREGKLTSAAVAVRNMVYGVPD
jgi:hypothetical protein